jgi:hypothetical protein
MMTATCPHPHKRGAADLVLFQARAALAETEGR